MSKEGMKFDGEKVRPFLLPIAELNKVVQVLEDGAQKYAPDNWKKISRERYYNSLMRHVFEYIEFAQDENMGGACMDKDSGRETLAHLICNALFLLYKDEEEEKIWKVEKCSRENALAVGLQKTSMKLQRGWGTGLRTTPVNLAELSDSKDHMYSEVIKSLEAQQGAGQNDSKD